MITAITGILEASGSDWVVIAVGGVSLRVQVPASALESLGPPGSQVRLATHLQVTEDTLLLYGFPQAEALRLFQMLLGVAGVGPRAGLSVLSAMATDEVAAAIASGDVKALSRAPGIGRKTASRIILELRGKIEQEWMVPAGAGSSPDGEVVAALTSLGYSEAEARQAVRALGDSTVLELEDRVRRALQQLGGHL